MRHLVAMRKLGRKTSHRIAMLRNLTLSLFNGEIIKTTLPKAKELRRFAEKIITIGKKDTVANRRLIVEKLSSKILLDKIFLVFGTRYANRPGGYLRIIKCGYRKGDNAPMAYVEMVDREHHIIENKNNDDKQT